MPTFVTHVAPNATSRITCASSRGDVVLAPQYRPFVNTLYSTSPR